MTMNWYIRCDELCGVAGQIYKEPGSSAGELVVIALAHAFALFAAISASMHVSGGHVNPAVTFGALLGGRISVLRAVYYWVAQLLGSIVAALLLRLVTNNMVCICATISNPTFPSLLLSFSLEILLDDSGHSLIVVKFFIKLNFLFIWTMVKNIDAASLRLCTNSIDMMMTLSLCFQLIINSDSQ